MRSRVEIDLVTGCDIRFDFEGTSLNISQGNAVFVNSQKIHSHYAEKLSLEKIASAASIGIRECSRCFDRSIRQSPMNYVSQYRVQMSLELLMTTGYTITEISEMCGFSSVSYFGKVFRKYISVTPVQYRAQLEKLAY